MGSIRISYKGQTIRENVKLPLSKSISNRALIISALSDGRVDPGPLSAAEDTLLLESLLSKVQKSSKQKLECRNAGTVLRFLTAYLATKPGRWTLDGDERMRQRPVGPLVEALQQIGADITYQQQKGYPPLLINGKALKGGTVEIRADISSQYTSALMMIAPMMPDGLCIKLRGATVSLPYIHMTENIMRQAGAEVELKLPGIRIEGKGYQQSTLDAEADWSAASAWYSIVALSTEAEIFIHGLKEDSLQGDSAIHKYFELLGVKTDFREGGIHLSKCHIFEKVANFDLNGYPDLAPSLIVTAAALRLKAHFIGLVNLRIKESDRLGAIATELEKAGIKCKVYQDELSFDAQQINILQPIETYNDHRMAMAFAPLAILGKPITINNPEVVNKSYPGYWEELNGVLRVELIE